MRDRLTICIVTPAPRGSRSGNRVTALRWAKRLRELGHHVIVREQWTGERCEVLVALHARRSHVSIARVRTVRPEVPCVLALTGTDVYGDLDRDETARASLGLATTLVVLQPAALSRLPPGVAARTVVIRQSARMPREPLRIAKPDVVLACVLGHLRDVKDPLLAARAVALLPAASRVRVVHLGAAPDHPWRDRAAAAETDSAGRWRWLGERPRAEALRILAGADLLVLTSVAEGGANVVTEAIACGIPVLSTRIDGSIGILGDDHPGYFPVGDAPALAVLLDRFATDPAFAAELRARSLALAPLVDPAAEREAWRTLLATLG